MEIFNQYLIITLGVLIIYFLVKKAENKTRNIFKSESKDVNDSYNVDNSRHFVNCNISINVYNLGNALENGGEFHLLEQGGFEVHKPVKEISYLQNDNFQRRLLENKRSMQNE